MKKIFTLLLLVCATASFAQTYNNEWINFNSDYYKFKVGKDGVYRITQATLATAGLGSVNAEHFQLFRNGVEVPLYTSVATGPIPESGYIEFWGRANDGKPDKALYRKPTSQHTEKYNLHSDSAAYFLTVNTTGSNLRFGSATNDLSGTLPPVEQYFMYTKGNYFKTRINPGFAAVIGSYVYSSSYDVGEFYSSAEIRNSAPLNTTVSNLKMYTGGTINTVNMRMGAVGNALYLRRVEVRVNNNVVKDTAMNLFDEMKTSASIPMNIFTADNATVSFYNRSDSAQDRMVISYYELTYPRKFDFEAATNFAFNLQGKASGDYYIEVTNFANGGQQPVLYDLTFNQRYVGNIATAGKIRFLIPGSTSDRSLVLVSQATANINNINAIIPKRFKNFLLPENQGDYIIITHPVLYTGSNGNNPVEDYQAYRNSTGFNAKIYEIQELVDQFAFGITAHPSSIKNFLTYARAKFSAPLKNVLLIGKGLTYTEQRRVENDPNVSRLNLIPTFGNPGSDNLLSSPNLITPIPVTPIGRLSVVYGSEIEDYLDKVKEYEAVQQTAPNTIDGRLWMKNILEVTGASDVSLGSLLCNYMQGYRVISTDTMVGANATVLCKSSINPTEPVSSEKISSLFEEGLSLVTYFGHSSASTLEFNIDNPQNYNSEGKYPIFSVNGCNAGNLFTFDLVRLQAKVTLSETFTLAKKRGAIAFIASTHLGVVNYLGMYIDFFYKSLMKEKYGRPLGEALDASLQALINANSAESHYARLHAEEITLHGDPAVYYNIKGKPDYIVENASVKIDPSFISIAEDKFDVTVTINNLGKAVSDSIVVEIKRQLPDQTETVLYRKKIAGVRYKTVINLPVTVVGSRDKGINKIIVTIDADNAVDEVSELNNTITKEVFIYEDEAKPAFPYNYSIVNDPAQKLFVSTADPFSSSKQYILEIDTTLLFNSTLKKQQVITSSGGFMEFAPQITYQDSTVYYWRVSLIPSAGGEYHWNNSSFLYLKDPVSGFAQVGYYQHIESTNQKISLDEDKVWRFGSTPNNVFIHHGTWDRSAKVEGDVNISVNGTQVGHNTCEFSSLVFNVFDPITFKPWRNVTTAGAGLYGSLANTCTAGREINFEYRYTDLNSRKKIMNFMENVIPAGYYVIVRTFALDPTQYPNFPVAYAPEWLKDTTTLGSQRSVNHLFYNQGFPQVDSFNRLRQFVVVYKKNDLASFPVKYVLTEGAFDKVVLNEDCPTPDSVGYIISPKFGPAKKWNELRWRGNSVEVNSADNPTIEIIGIKTDESESSLFKIDKSQQDFDLSSVDAEVYPFIKLKMRNIDSVTLTPYQLKYWQLDYNPVPEGALAPNLLFQKKDSMDVGEKFDFGIAFKNISQASFDSVSMKAYILDRDNRSHDIIIPKLKPLISGDTVSFKHTIDTKDFPGNNILFVEFNPEGNQLEQYHYNNFMYRNFYVKPDSINPTMDVTFDGVHILNRDLVSATPTIVAKLKDNAKYMLLNDTALATVKVRFPDNTVRTYQYGDSLRFMPAQSGSDNTASIEFKPYFPQINEAGDDYELIITAKDKSGNKAGQNEYRVAFKVINKPMISNLLNYPNPFTTSTAFVFTITGSEIPQQFKIEILTVTGKVVREITKDELGPLHIGRNITEFKWDGTDRYGQRLANGVYLYRVVTTLNGKRMEKYKAEGDQTDKFFNKGYGKMYLMK